MQELITISTGEQGSPVVSARELYYFLEVKSKFADWIKNRIIRYGFLEDTDYVAVSKNLETGGWEHDYALTLDMAKELAMVERTPKGKQARQYFIEAEKTLRQTLTTPPAISTTEQVLIQLVSQQTRLLTNQGEMLVQLRADVDQIMATGHKPSRVKPTPALPPVAFRLSQGASLRRLINQRVNDYCAMHQVTQSETYTYLYKKLHETFGIVVYQMNRIGKESYLDALERYGHLDRLYSLAMSLLTYSEE